MVPKTTSPNVTWQRLKLLVYHAGIAYLDPGNLESQLQAGANSGYTLIWVLMWVIIMVSCRQHCWKLLPVDLELLATSGKPFHHILQHPTYPPADRASQRLTLVVRFCTAGVPDADAGGEIGCGHRAQPCSAVPVLCSTFFS